VTKPRKSSKLMIGMQQMLAHARGELKAARVTVVHVPNVKAIRKHLAMTQKEFAASFHLPLGTVREWEIGRRVPDQAAQVLLSVIAAKPKLVQKVVAKSRQVA